MTLGQLLAIIVLLGALLSFLIALPEWAVMVFILVLAIALLTINLPLFTWRASPPA